MVQKINIKIFWSPSALRHLKSWIAYIASDSVKAAEKERVKLLKSVKRLLLFPKSGRIVPEFNNETLREIIKPPIRIIYRLLEGEIQVLSLCHDHQEIDARLFARLSDG